MRRRRHFGVDPIDDFDVEDYHDLNILGDLLGDFADEFDKAKAKEGK